MKILISHPSSNLNNRNTVLALEKNKMLFKFITSVNFNTNNVYLKLLPKKIIEYLDKRNFSKITKNIITRNLFIEIFNLIKKNILKLSHVEDYYRIDKFTSNYLNKNNKKIDAVYCYEDAALETFRVAKKYKIKTIYELPISYWKEHCKILKKENKRFGISQNLNIKQSLIKKNKELNLADIIIVPSNFVKKTLLKSKFKNKKIITIPYGFNQMKVNIKNKPLKKVNLLFVGNLTPRKGIIYLVKAFNKISSIYKNINLTIVGKGPLKSLIKKNPIKINLIDSLPHDQILKLMKQQDIFIFPSLFEGFGLVISEAMSAGMLVMSTKNTALPEISDKSSSVFIKTNSHIDIVKKLILLIKNKNKFNVMRKNSILKSQNYNWNKYQKNLILNLKRKLI